VEKHDILLDCYALEQTLSAQTREKKCVKGPLNFSLRAQWCEKKIYARKADYFFLNSLLFAILLAAEHDE
jgi:hypothetical protein